MDPTVYWDVTQCGVLGCAACFFCVDREVSNRLHSVRAN